MDVSKQEIPTLEIERAENIVRTILNRYDGKVTPTTEDELAQDLDHNSANSGAFRSKLADLRKYNFLDGWGDKQLTPLGRKLVDNKQRVARTVINDNVLFKTAHDHFDTSLPDETEWDKFVERQEIDLNDSDKRQARKTYNSLIKQLPKQNEDPFPEEYFDKYYKNLQVDAVSARCLDSLEELAKRPIPSIEYYDKIFDPVKGYIDFQDRQHEESIDSDELTPDQFQSFVTILSEMSRTSANLVREKRGENTVEVALELIQDPPTESITYDAIRVLASLNPSEVDQKFTSDIWDIARTYQIDGFEQDVHRKREAGGQLFELLIERWADKELLEQIEDDLFELIKSYDTTGEKKNEFGRRLGNQHRWCQEELGLVQPKSEVGGEKDNDLDYTAGSKRRWGWESL